MDEDIKLSLAGLKFNAKIRGTYALELKEINGTRMISILIGENEANSITMRLNDIRPARPLTHDLIENILSRLQATLVKVVIYDLQNGICVCYLYFLNSKGDLDYVDARISDAVAMAVRCNIPIFIKKSVIDLLDNLANKKNNSTDDGLINVADKTQSVDMNDIDLSKLSDTELNELLLRAIEEEKYEVAAKIRDAINRQ
ncbi:MAG: bifunctional nuclease family protein [Paludibacter sp.]|jgi:bifunctional DNase/RNase|nr:bifunctional nuclease family protein [Paludibacter sp.]